MKRVLLLLLLITFTTYGQKRIKEYKASNGVTYKENDTIKLGIGSGLQGTFVNLHVGGWAMGGGPIGSSYANTGVIVKKMKKGKIKGVEKVIFTVGGGNITNYYLDIEPAIQTCEVTPCNDKKGAVVIQEDDKYDKLAKLKALLDDGVLTQEEFDKEKQKILKSN